MILTPLILIDSRRELIIKARAGWSGDRKAAWKEAWKAKLAVWNRKKGQKDAPAPVFVDKKKRALEKLGKFNYTGTIPDRVKVKMEPVVEGWGSELA